MYGSGYEITLSQRPKFAGIYTIVADMRKIVPREEYKGLAKDYDETPYQMIPVEGGYIMNYDHTSRIWNDNMYLYPVPKQCFVLNPNLDQNPGW